MDHQNKKIDLEKHSYKNKKASLELIEMEGEYAAHNYHPLPIVFEKANGVHVYDPEGKHYYDFLSAYSAVNQGHCHPKIISTMIEQATKVTLSSRAFYNTQFPLFAKFVTEFFGYESVLPMNTGAEAVETAIKVARKWGYEKKGIPDDKAVIIGCKGSFHGRTVANISLSDDPQMRNHFGPLVPLIVNIPYNDPSALSKMISEHGQNVAAFIVEPIQGEAGVIVPDEGYLKSCYEICKKNNVLFIADEIQTGVARTGRLLCCDWEEFKPDIVILGKALSGGLVPLSCVLTSKNILSVIHPGEHGSTFGGNPLSSAIGITALQVVKDEQLAHRADVLGEKFRKALHDLNIPFVTAIRGKGLLNAIVIDSTFSRTAWQICLLMAHRGLLCKPTHDNIIRLTPPLVITDEQLDECVQIIKGVLMDIENIKVEDIPGIEF